MNDHLHDGRNAKGCSGRNGHNGRADACNAMRNDWNSTAGAFPAPFDVPFYIIFNVAVGGNFPGNPDGTTALPVTMEVDWVRVYSGEP